MGIECGRRWQQKHFTQVYCETVTINIHHSGRLLVRQQIEPSLEAFQDVQDRIQSVSGLIRPHVQLFLC